MPVVVYELVQGISEFLGVGLVILETFLVFSTKPLNDALAFLLLRLVKESSYTSKNSSKNPKGFPAEGRITSFMASLQFCRITSTRTITLKFTGRNFLATPASMTRRSPRTAAPTSSSTTTSPLRNRQTSQECQHDYQLPIHEPKCIMKSTIPWV